MATSWLQPTLLFATDYEALTHIADYLGPRDVALTCLPAPADVISLMFLAADVFSLIFEIIGGVMTARAGSSVRGYTHAQNVSRWQWAC